MGKRDVVHKTWSIEFIAMSFEEDRATATGNTYRKLERMPNVMVALPNIGGALCSTPQSLADAHY